MEWSTNCPECGFEMTYGQIESTVTWTCPKCGWRLASTYVSPISQDEKTYEIVLSKNTSPNSNQLKLLSQISGINFLQAKRMLESDNSSLFKGNATDVLQVKKQLEKEGIAYSITPEYNY